MYVQNHLGWFSNSFSVSNSGNSGDLALFWSNEIPYRVLSSFVHHIDAEIGMADDVCQWRIIGFYGFIATTERYKSLLILGDFMVSKYCELITLAYSWGF